MIQNYFKVPIFLYQSGVDESEDIVDGKFRVQCKTNGVFDDNITWPICNVENCTQLSIIQDGFIGNASELPVAVYGTVGYR